MTNESYAAVIERLTIANAELIKRLDNSNGFLTGWMHRAQTAEAELQRLQKRELERAADELAKRSDRHVLDRMSETVRDRVNALDSETSPSSGQCSDQWTPEELAAREGRPFLTPMVSTAKPVGPSAFDRYDYRWRLDELTKRVDDLFERMVGAETLYIKHSYQLEALEDRLGPKATDEELSVTARLGIHRDDIDANKRGLRESDKGLGVVERYLERSHGTRLGAETSPNARNRLIPTGNVRSELERIERQLNCTHSRRPPVYDIGTDDCRCPDCDGQARVSDWMEVHAGKLYWLEGDPGKDWMGPFVESKTSYPLGSTVLCAGCGKALVYLENLDQWKCHNCGATYRKS